MTQQNFNKLGDFCFHNNIEAYASDDGLVIKTSSNWVIVPTGNKPIKRTSNPPIKNPSGRGRAITENELSKFM